MSSLLDRITVNPKQCGGRPCIRGMRIRVSDVLDLLAASLSFEQILEEMPDLDRRSESSFTLRSTQTRSSSAWSITTRNSSDAVVTTNVRSH